MNEWYLLHDFNYATLLEHDDANPHFELIDLDHVLLSAFPTVMLREPTAVPRPVATAAFTYSMDSTSAQDLASNGVAVYPRLDDLMYDLVLARKHHRPKRGLVWPEEFRMHVSEFATAH